MPDITTTAVGTLSGEVELRYSQGGNPFCDFTIGMRETRGETTSWTNIRCKAFGTLAENLAASCNKGDRLIVFGRLTEEHWEKDGQKRSAFRLMVDDAGPALRFATCNVERIERK